MPESVLFLIILVLVPLALTGWVIRRAYASRLEALLVALFALLLLAFLFQWGQYPYVGSYYLRYLLLLGAGAAAGAVFRAARGVPWYVRPGWRKAFGLGLLVPGIVVLLLLNGRAWQARYTSVPAADLAFPLRGSTYYISTGGTNGVLNLHHKPNTPAQHYAIDIDRLDAWGRHARSLLPDRLEDYLVYGETVYSPSDGRVVEARDGVADHRPLAYDPATGAGNYVVIERADGLQVALYHLMQGSVRVQPGDQVAEGAPVGRVGNSGFSVHPHLHLQVSRSRRAAATASRTGVPARFQGRLLVRNSLFAGRE